MRLTIEPPPRHWSPATSCFELSLLGGFELRANGRQVWLRSRKACAILAYLALTGASAPRERMTGLLWSDTTEARARASLRQVLHGAREELRAAGMPILALSRASVDLHRDSLGLDVDVLQEDLRFGTLHRQLSAGRSASAALCEDLQGLDPAFDAWLGVQRELMQRRLVGGLEGLLASRATARGAALAILALDPTHEAASRSLMALHARAGDVAAALRVYKDLWDLLDREYDSEPSPETRDLVAAIKMEALPSRPAHGPAQVAVAGGDPRPQCEGALTLISVSRFDAASVREELAYAVDGLRHEIVASLVRFREWAVVDGEGASEGEGSSAARRFSLDGTVAQDGPVLFVTLTLKQRPTGRYVWSEAFAFSPPRWSELRLRLVARIAAALNVRLSLRRTGSELDAEISASTYDLWLRGHQLLSSWRAVDRQRASDMLMRVLETAPDFAPAYASLVRLRNSEHIVRPGVGRDESRAREALRFASAGVRLDPLNSRAHLGLAWSYAMTGRHGEAEASFRDAVELNGSDVWTLVSSAQGLSFCGRHDEAVRLADRALEIDANPTRPAWGYQVGIRYLAGDYDGALEAARLADDVISNLPAWKAATLARLDRPDAARIELSRFLSITRSAWQGRTAATDAEIGSWLLGSFPIRHERDVARLRDGLVAAGLVLPGPRDAPGRDAA